MMKVEYGTDIGPVRSSNQDACECGLFSENSAWAIVCDGMGGANGGDVASKTAVEELKKTILSEFAEDMTAEQLRAMLSHAIQKANTAVYSLSREHSALRGMGTTVVLMIAAGKMLHIAHVGDSRAYLYGEHEIKQVTTDHSYVQDLVKLGHITQEEAKVHPQRNIITRVLGVHPEVQCDYFRCDFTLGDIALACSDGLSNYVPEEQLKEYISQYQSDGPLLVEKLIRHATDHGGSDNITVAVLLNL